jgi:hypothetical protein
LVPGGALLHLVDAKVGDQKVEGSEIIGYDRARGGYVTQYSEKDRFRGTFNDERNVITGHRDAFDDDSTWRRWMDIALTREARCSAGRRRAVRRRFLRPSRA